MQSTDKYSDFGDVCAVVVTYNIGSRIDLCLNSLFGQVEHVVFVDNGSTDDTRQILEKHQAAHPDFITFLNNPENGLAKAQNMGIQQAKQQGFGWVMLLDHDSRLAEGYTDAMKAAYASLPEPQRVGILAPYIHDTNANKEPTYVTPFTQFWFRRETFGNRPILPHVINAICSGSLFPISIFDKLGMLDESFFIDYVDTDFCMRVISNGYLIVAVRDAVLHHQLGERKPHRLMGFSIVATNHSPLRRYYIYRNKMRTLGRYFFKVPPYIMYDISGVIYDLVRITLYEDRKEEKLRAILRGVWDGVRGVTGPLKH